MSRILSWQRRGQKVALRPEFDKFEHPPGQELLPEPRPDVVYTIATVVFDWSVMATMLSLAELPARALYTAESFLPVYPHRVEELRRLGAPVREEEPA